nr:hypothetical protein [uncultured Mediterraneibacter sp.]
MFLIFLLLTISFDILLFKILTYKKKDEKEYFYKVNEELEKNFVENSTYEGTVYFNSEFIPNILIKNGDEIICLTGTNVDQYQKVDFSKENIIRRNNCKISLNDDIIFKEYKYKIEFYFILEKPEYIYEINALVKSENNENLDTFIVCHCLEKEYVKLLVRKQSIRDVLYIR